MGLFGMSWGTVITGAATGAAFLFGGPVASGLIGAAAGGLRAALDGKSWEVSLESALVGGALGAIPGGLIGGATKGIVTGGGKALATSFKDVPALLSKGSGLGSVADRLAFARAPMNRLGLGAVTAGVSTALGTKAFNTARPHRVDLPAELPTKIIAPTAA